MGVLIDLTGRVFGRLTVVHRTKGAHPKKTYWNCLCLCGNTVITRSDALLIGHTQSCGCYLKDNPSYGNTKHGMHDAPEHWTWCGIKARCNNPKNNVFDYYGERGIKVCDRWLQSFDNFFQDMGKRPPNHSIERRDNDGDYEPSNCYWATKKEQALNRRSTIHIELNGVKMTLTDFAKLIGKDRGNVSARFKKIGHDKMLEFYGFK